MKITKSKNLKISRKEFRDEASMSVAYIYNRLMEVGAAIPEDLKIYALLCADLEHRLFDNKED